MENSEDFKGWLTRFARQWGSFLDTPESFNQEILVTRQHSQRLRVLPDSRCGHHRYLTGPRWRSRDVGMVPVRMAHVASVVLTAAPGTSLAEGAEFGYFQFGGSDIILLFQAGVQALIDTDPSPRVVGSIVAQCTRR